MDSLTITSGSKVTQNSSLTHELNSDWSPRFDCLLHQFKEKSRWCRSIKQQNKKRTTKPPSSVFRLKITFRIFIWMSSSHWLLHLQRKELTLLSIWFSFIAFQMWSAQQHCPNVQRHYSLSTASEDKSDTRVWRDQLTWSEAWGLHLSQSTGISYLNPVNPWFLARPTSDWRF